MDESQMRQYIFLHASKFNLNGPDVYGIFELGSVVGLKPTVRLRDLGL